MTIPELSGPADVYYSSKESSKYHKNSRIAKIQTEITHRAIELLEIEEEKAVVLDLGCGSGLSGNVIAEYNHSWVGVDISPDMLKIATENPMNCLSLVCRDMGTRLPFQDESFDYGISISAVQWLFQSYKKEDDPIRRIKEFFRGLYRVTKKRIVIQFYCGKKETEILKREARVAGFAGGIVIDEEGTKNCKVFLVLDKNKFNKEIIKNMPVQEEDYKADNEHHRTGSERKWKGDHKSFSRENGSSRENGRTKESSRKHKKSQTKRE